MEKYSLKSLRAFTLIELLVAVAIFSVVMILGLSTVITLSKSQSASQPIENTMQSGNLAMEMMVTKIKEATSVSAPLSLAPTSVLNLIPLKSFALYNSSGSVSGVSCGVSPCYVGMNLNGTVYRMTSPDVNVSQLGFTGIPTGASVKPYVTINMVLASTWAKSGEAPLTLHTTVIPLRFDPSFSLKN